MGSTLAMTNIERRIQSLYDRVNERAAEWKHARLIANAGFRILCGPPLPGKPMVVSPNPAWPGNATSIPGDDNLDFWPKSWPKRMSYPTGQSLFAQRITEVLQNAEIPIDGVNVGYVSMFRCNGREQWKEEVPSDVRKCAEHLSLEVLTEIIEVLEPRFIYVSGFGAFTRMGCSRERGEHGRLVRFDNYRGRQVIASQVLSGGRPPLTGKDRDQIAEELARFQRTYAG
jgi:hypothetical protein